MRDKFTNPRNGEIYEWHTGHSEEEANGKTRTIQESANTGNTGLVKQQGDVQPLVLKYSGTILFKKQIEEFWRWYELCETQTIFFTDYAGEEYEVLITSFLPQRKPTVKNPKDFANAPRHYWSYSITMEVIAVRSGVMSGVTP